MKKLQIYHGSPRIVEEPAWGVGKAYNDYGTGFYCTQQAELAKEWACTEGRDGYVNHYEIQTKGLQILDLSLDTYTMLHWLALLVTYRRLRLSSPVMRQGIKWLQQHFLVDLSAYDIVKGYRADDSYFSFARAFVANEISYEQLCRAMRLGRLGEQFVLKSQKAFEQIQFISYETVDHEVYYTRRKARDDKARNEYFAESERDDLDGIFMRDIIREEMKPEDVRLRSKISG